MVSNSFCRRPLRWLPLALVIKPARSPRFTSASPAGRILKMVSNSFCRRPLRWLPLALVSLWSLSAQSSGHLKVGEPSKVAAARGAAVEAKIPVTVDAGFHVNSNHPSEDYLIPLKLTWTSLGALEGGEVRSEERRVGKEGRSRWSP